MKRLELDILHCGDCPYCQLVYNFLNLERSKYHCFHPQNMTLIDSKKNIEENGWSLLESCPLKDKEGPSDRYGDPIKYQVRFVCYRYNSGAGDNGYINCSRYFDNLEEAEKLSRKIGSYLKTRKNIKNPKLKAIHDDHYKNTGIFLKNITKAESNFVEDFIYSGYIHSYDGIYEISERRID